MPETPSIAVCVSADFTLSDFITPVEIILGSTSGTIPSLVCIHLHIIPPPCSPVRRPSTDLITKEHRIPKVGIDFIAAQAPKAKHIISVCAGAIHLALAGVLSGKQATTNKSFYHIMVSSLHLVASQQENNFNSCPGGDMALAFVEHLVGKKAATVIRGGVEVPEDKDQDDPFAEFHGLI
ncbi:hypothetical protein B0H10DRAFT_2339041 [Mycena sp. CBHHK59/15]|nr:hypothetical protein B0H10DRAFT_2339041 [Mycena sp. CBHHK59/15]